MMSLSRVPLSDTTVTCDPFFSFIGPPSICLAYSLRLLFSILDIVDIIIQQAGFFDQCIIHDSLPAHSLPNAHSFYQTSVLFITSVVLTNSAPPSEITSCVLYHLFPLFGSQFTWEVTAIP